MKNQINIDGIKVYVKGAWKGTDGFIHATLQMWDDKTIIRTDAIAIKNNAIMTKEYDNAFVIAHKGAIINMIRRVIECRN